MPPLAGAQTWSRYRRENGIVTPILIDQAVPIFFERARSTIPLFPTSAYGLWIAYSYQFRMLSRQIDVLHGMGPLWNPERTPEAV